NALAHAAEGLYAEDRNPVASLMAGAGAGAPGRGAAGRLARPPAPARRRPARALPGIVAAPTARAAREQALYGAWLAGAVLGQVAMSLHHKLCHTLGGSFDLPHAE